MPEQEEEVCGTYYGGIFVYFGLSNMVRLFASHRTLWVGYYVGLGSSFSDLLFSPFHYFTPLSF